jgi:hypothetical protein
MPIGGVDALVVRIVRCQATSFHIIQPVKSRSLLLAWIVLESFRLKVSAPKMTVKNVNDASMRSSEDHY